MMISGAPSGVPNRSSLSDGTLLPPVVFPSALAIFLIGGIGPNITNMRQANQLQGGESFLLCAFRCVFLGCALADVNSFMINNTVRLIIGTGNYAYCDAPAEYWAGGAGAYGGTSAAATNGIPDPRAIVPFDVDPILLTDGVNFYVNIVGTAFTASTSIVASTGALSNGCSGNAVGPMLAVSLFSITLNWRRSTIS